MSKQTVASLPRLSGLAVLALLTGGLAGMTLAAWVAMGPDMFMALVESGLATCF